MSWFVLLWSCCSFSDSQDSVSHIPRWHHDMEMLSALLGGIHQSVEDSHRNEAIMQSFEVSLILGWASYWTNSQVVCHLSSCDIDVMLNTLRPRQNGSHFTDDTFKCIFLNENAWISLKISLKFVPKVQINNIPALVQIMAWRRPGDKPLSEPMIVSLLTHICVTLPQWVNVSFLAKGEIICSGFFFHIMKTIWFRTDSRLTPSQWRTSLQSNAISHWLGTNLASVLWLPQPMMKPRGFNVSLTVTKLQQNTSTKLNLTFNFWYSL